MIYTAYWGGYFKESPCETIRLCDIPEDIDYVILAFVGPLPDSTLETVFLCSQYSEDKIKQWVKDVQARGIKVFMSILDTPQTHWNVVDIPKFAQSVKEIALDEWGVDGLDIDAESGMTSNYIESFISLAENLKLVLGDKPLTYTCYTGTQGPDGKILKVIKDKLDWIQLMAYFDDYNEMINLYNNYKTIMGDKICIGVKAPVTPLIEVKNLCKWNSNKQGMMLWTINRDVPYYTNKPKFLWSRTISQNIK